MLATAPPAVQPTALNFWPRSLTSPDQPRQTKQWLYPALLLDTFHVDLRIEFDLAQPFYLAKKGHKPIRTRNDKSHAHGNDGYLFSTIGIDDDDDDEISQTD